MNKASPLDLRKAIEVANIYVKAGILFVPMPVLSEEDHAARVKEADARLDLLMIGAEES